MIYVKRKSITFSYQGHFKRIRTVRDFIDANLRNLKRHSFKFFKFIYLQQRKILVKTTIFMKLKTRGIQK